MKPYRFVMLVSIAFFSLSGLSLSDSHKNNWPGGFSSLIENCAARINKSLEITRSIDSTRLKRDKQSLKEAIEIIERCYSYTMISSSLAECHIVLEAMANDSITSGLDQVGFLLLSSCSSVKYANELLRQESMNLTAIINSCTHEALLSNSRKAKGSVDSCIRLLGSLAGGACGEKRVALRDIIEIESGYKKGFLGRSEWSKSDLRIWLRWHIDDDFFPIKSAEEYWEDVNFHLRNAFLAIDLNLARLPKDKSAHLETFRYHCQLSIFFMSYGVLLNRLNSQIGRLPSPLESERFYSVVEMAQYVYSPWKRGGVACLKQMNLELKILNPILSNVNLSKVEFLGKEMEFFNFSVSLALFLERLLNSSVPPWAESKFKLGPGQF